jgi:ATP-dependent helicase/nuclease subunit A
VRILTIHSAKGLEAPIVVLVDANHSEPARDDCGILCDWPQDADAPTHFSCFGRKDERGAARDELFAAEEAFRQQEDWNLLYVAMTRAKELLIVSGVAGTRNARPDGAVEGSWYQRIQAVPEFMDENDNALVSVSVQAAVEFSMPIFSPPILEDEVALEAERAARARASAIAEGIALHTLLERLTQFDTWPVEMPETCRIARWLSCSVEMADIVRERALNMLAAPALERFFNPAYFSFARNELEVLAGDETMRFDRAVVFDEEVWILDYKRDVLESEHADYAAQLQRYRQAAATVFPGMRLKTALVTPDGRLWEME